MVLKVTSYDRFKPFSGFHNRFVHPLSKLLFQGLQLRPHPLLHRLAIHHKITRLPVLPAHVRKSQKVERLRFSFAATFSILCCVPPKLDQPRLLRVQFQAKLSQPFPQFSQKPLRCLTTAYAKLKVGLVRYSFPVRLFHSLLHAALSRRTDSHFFP